MDRHLVETTVRLHLVVLVPVQGDHQENVIQTLREFPAVLSVAIHPNLSSELELPQDSGNSLLPLQRQLPLLQPCQLLLLLQQPPLHFLVRALGMEAAPEQFLVEQPAMEAQVTSVHS